MFNDPTPRPAEFLHSRACLAAAVIAAVENLRDEDRQTDLAFRLALQDNVLAVADGYLADGLMFCRCPEPEVCGAQYLDYDTFCTLDAGHDGDHTSPTGDDDGVWAWAPTCAGSGHPVGAASRCATCGTSFGFPHPAGLVVGALAPVHA
jgi:hypothetical protein